MVNSSPTSALGGMSPTEALFGTKPAVANRPSVDKIVQLLGLSSSAEATGAPIFTSSLAPATHRRSSAPPRKRQRTQPPTAAASDSDDECVDAAHLDAAQAALEFADSASPPTRRSARSNAGGRLELLLAEEQLGEAAEADMRALPQRAAAVNSPAGKRRQQAGLLQQLAEIASEHEAAEEPCSEEEAAVAGGWAGGGGGQGGQGGYWQGWAGQGGAATHRAAALCAH
jgi:hypothetical protein